MVTDEVPREALLPYLPPGVELDPPEGPALASLVGFLFLDTRLKGVPVPFHRDFEEVNLRFYVRRPDPSGEGWRRGVAFVKEIVPRAALAAVARAAYGERYVARPMRHRRDEGLVEYAWHEGGRWHSLAARPVGGAAEPAPGSHEDFVTDHLWGYVRRRGGGGTEYEVRHPRWRVRRVEDVRVDVDVGAVYGEAFAGAFRGAPVSAFVAEGSPVEVWPGRRLDASR